MIFTALVKSFGKNELQALQKSAKLHKPLDYLVYNDPVGYADLILNGDPEEYLRKVTDYSPLD